MSKAKTVLGHLAAALLLSALGLQASAQVSRSIELLHTNTDQRTSALGDAMAARQDRMSLFVSPLALIPGDNAFGVEVSSQLFPKVADLKGNSDQYNAVAGFKFLDRHAVSVSFRYQGAPEIEYFYIDRPTPTEGDAVKTIRPFEWAIDLAYGFQISRDFSAMVSGNFVTSWIGVAGYTGGASVGGFYNHDFGSAGILGVGLKVEDLGAPIQYQGGRAYAMPASARLSAEYGLEIAEKHSLDFLLGGRYFFLPITSQLLTVGAGVEYAFDELIFARVGGQFGTHNLSKITAGAGVKILGSYALDFSWSHGLAADVGIDVWSVGLSARF